MSPLRNQSKGPGKHLQSYGQAEAQGTELIDTTLEKEPNVGARVWMDGNLKVGIPDFYKNIQSPFQKDPKTDTTVSILNFVNVKKSLRADRSMTGLQPPVAFSTRKRVVEAQTGLVNNLQSPFLKHLLELLLRSKCMSQSPRNIFFFFLYEWEHRTGKMCPFSSLHPLKKGKEV